MKEGAPELVLKRPDNQTENDSAINHQESVFIEGLTPYENAKEFIEGLPKRQQELGRREAALHNHFWGELPPTHETTIKVKEILDKILERAGLPKDFLELGIFNSNLPDAHVQLIAKKVRISRKFIEEMKGNPEYIASVIAHEVGHILLSHFRSAEPGSYDPLNEHIQGYEHEYQADRASVILTNRMGIPANTLGEALTAIERDLYSRNVTNEDMSMLPDFNHRAWVLSTHPHTPRRVMAINRDSAGLPRYKRQIEFEAIPIPNSGDFPQVDYKKWGVLDERIQDLETFPDCLWEEMQAPESVKGRVQMWNEKKKAPEERWEIGSPEFIIARKEKLKTAPLDATPEDVASWNEKNSADMDKWWAQAIQLMNDMDGYLDLSDEVREYPLEVVKLLLNKVRVELFPISEYETRDDDDQIQDIDASKDYAKDILLTDTGNYHYSTNMAFVTSLLLRTWSEKDPTLGTVAGIKELGKFLRDFCYEHGAYLPYAGARFFLRLEDAFNSTQNDEDKEELVEFCKEYEQELIAGVKSGKRLVGLMPNLYAYMTSKNKKIFVPGKENWKTQKTVTIYQLPEEIQNAADKKDLSAEEARQALALVPKNFRPKNLSMLLFSTMKEEDERIDKEGYSDAVLETDTEAQAAILSSNEFDEKYFGSGRQFYIKAKYESIDKNIPEYGDIYQLWQKAGYQSEFETMDSGIVKLKFLLENLPVRSAMRDVLIAESLSWEKITHVEDVMKIQEVVLQQTDVALLFELSDMFSNPLLSLTVSQRLWELFQQNSSNFFSQIPTNEHIRIKEELQSLPENLRGQQLQAILLCYKEPTYVRDELLRPLVDAAPDQASTMAIASWYCEPPPGVLRPRSGEVVAVTETLLDAVRGMPQLDKQELFLYFLGHRLFYSGIDSKWFANLRASEKEFRSSAIFLGEEMFLEKYGLQKSEDVEEDEDDLSENLEYKYSSRRKSRIDEKYLVESPDSLIFLIKSSGVPVDLLLRQQRLTTTRREQRDFITHLLLGNEGILTQGNKDEFLTAVARNVVDNSSWASEQTEDEKHSVADLLSFALNNCPNRRLPDLFLGLWNLQQEKGSLPQIMTTLLRELGSLFIKAGQYLGTQSNSLPVEWIQSFRTLSDQNMRAEKTLIYEHEYALYGDDSPFQRIGEKQGEGSMAAVYKGELKEGYTSNGREVATKIFHPNIKEELDEDAKFLGDLVKFINERRSAFKVRLPDNLSDVSKNQILNELSYDNMIKNSQDIAKVLDKSKADMKWRVPQIIQDLSKSEFIVYQYAPGVPLDKLPENIRGSVRSEVAMELLRQILMEGTYQGDPNVGNFKAMMPENPRDKVLVDWLDTDHTGRFTKEEARRLRGFVKEMAFGKNIKTISESLSSFVQSSTEVSPDFLREEIENWLSGEKVLEGASVENLESIFISFLDFLADKKLVLKEQYVTLLRTLGLMKPMLEDVKQSQYLAFFTKLMFSH